MRHLQQFSTGAQGVFVQPELDEVPGLSVDEIGLALHQQTRLVGGFPVAAGRVVLLALAGPDEFLAFDQHFAGSAQSLQLVGWNHIAQDQVAFSQKLGAVELHV